MIRGRRAPRDPKHRRNCRACPRSFPRPCRRSELTNPVPGGQAGFPDQASLWRRQSPLPPSAQARLVINDHRREAALLAEHAHETESLARTVDALTARLSAIDSAKAHDELIELRRSIGEIRSSSASSQELSAALAQLSQRVERLDREESARVRQTRGSFRPRSRRASRRIVSPHRKTREEGHRGRSSASIRRPQARPCNRSSPRFRPSSARMSPWRRPVRSKGRAPCCAGTSCSEFATMSL